MENVNSGIVRTPSPLARYMSKVDPEHDWAEIENTRPAPSVWDVNDALSLIEEDPSYQTNPRIRWILMEAKMKGYWG